MAGTRLIVEPGGRLRIDPAGADHVALASPGTWRIFASDPAIVILERVEDGRRPIAGGDEIILCGDLGSAGIVDVVSFIQAQAKTGVLTLIRGRVRKTILFERGNIRAAASNLPEDRLGELLYRSGRLSYEQLQNVIKQLSPTRKIGRILVDNGYINANELWNFIRQQVEEIFYSTLLFRDGAFILSALSANAEDQFPAQITLSAQSLLLDGLRRIDEMSAFREKIPSDQTVVVRCEPVPSTKLEPIEEKLLALVQQSTTVADLVLASHLGEFETTKIVFRLIQTRFVRIVEEAPGARLKGVDATAEYQRVIGVFNEIYREVYAAMVDVGRERAFRSAVEGFLGAGGSSDLLRRVPIGPDGGLDPAVIVRNLAGFSEGSHADALYMALNELVFFQLFNARDNLRGPDEKRLMKRVNELFQTFSPPPSG
ncbi:MAG: DUF4388 domain-containing protein [Deltaproteobacteria bacterium]|nr:DUF4388 domain-containing protein [Deltaproteobacteria bacterium]